MYKFNKVNLSVSTVVYTAKTAFLNDVYSAYCRLSYMF